MRQHRDTHGRGPRWAAPLGTALIWGVNVPVMKAAVGAVHPYLFNALRLTLSALVLGAWSHVEARGRGGAAAKREATPWVAVVWLGLLTSFAYQVLFLAGVARTSASHTGFLIASGPLWTAAIARLLGVERPNARAWAGLAIAFVGTALVATAKDTTGATLLGNGLLLFAMLTWALATVLSRSLVLTRLSATRMAFLFTCVALPGHWALAWPRLGALASGAPDGLGPAAWASVVFSGAFSTGVAYILWNTSLVRIGPARTSAFSNLVPLVALALAWGFLGERPGVAQLAGGALILIGIASWRSARSG